MQHQNPGRAGSRPDIGDPGGGQLRSGEEIAHAGSKPWIRKIAVLFDKKLLEPRRVRRNRCNGLQGGVHLTFTYRQSRAPGNDPYRPAREKFSEQVGGTG